MVTEWVRRLDRLLETHAYWAYVRVRAWHLRSAQYRPLRGGTYAPLPRALPPSRAIVNVVNDDNRCFMWSVVAALCEPLALALKSGNFGGEAFFADALALAP